MLTIRVLYGGETIKVYPDVLADNVAAFTAALKTYLYRGCVIVTQ